jgi:ubiquinone/menaquinone biosynthesis C-methylase UbiE
MDRLERILRDLDPSLVLDVATGAGNMARHLRSEYGRMGAIIAMDVSEEAIRRSRSSLEGIEETIIVCGDSVRMPFGEGDFDLITVSNSLHHLEDLNGSLSEMNRTLAPGGCVLINEMYRDGQTEEQMTHVLMHDWWAEIDMMGGVSHYPTFERKRILELLEKLQLKREAVMDYSHLETDPREEKLLQSLDRAVDAYLEKLESSGGDEALSKRGEELRTRVHEIGFHGATTLAAVYRKPTLH